MSQSSFQGFLSPRPNKGGTNTGDATATAADLTLGKTAYAVGVKVTGTGANAKLYASGNTVSSASTLLFTDAGGVSQALYPVTVTGLSLPNGIAFVTLRKPSAPGSADDTFYSTGAFTATGPCNIFNTFNNMYLRLTGNATVSNTGFQLPVGSASNTYTWEVWGT